MIKKTFLFLLLFSTSTLLAEDETTTDKILDGVKKGWDTTVDYSEKKIAEMKVAKKSRENRGAEPLNFNFAPVTFGIYYPVKSSYIGEYNFSSDHSIAIEYLTGGYSLKFSKIDLAEIKESVLMIPFKYYWGTNSFFIKYGLGIRSYKISIGSEYINKIAFATGDKRIYGATALKISNEVVNLGIGNSWQWESGFNFGFEWVEIFLPLGKGKVEEDIGQYLTGDERDNWYKVVNTLETKLSFNVLKFKIGWAF